MTDWSNYWLDRAGQMAGATVTSVSPEPQYGAALDIATGPLSPEEYTSLLNDVQTVYEDEEEVQQHGWWSTVTGAVGDAIGWVGDRFSDIDDLRDKSRRAVLPDAYVDATDRIDEQIGGAVGTGFEWLDRAAQPINRGIAAPFNALNLSAETRDNFWDFELLEGETWSEAWKRSEYTTFGQALVENATMDPEQRATLHAGGFNETNGLPNNPAYADIRMNDPRYNIVSGSFDFLRTWFTDPAVIAGKGITVSRALVKADLQRMPAPIRNQFFRTLTAPADEFEKLKAAKPKNPITRRAITVRENINELADRVRKEELSVPEVAEMQSFAQGANGAAAANAFVHAARMKRFDTEEGWTDEFDQDLFDTTVAAMMGHVGAMDRLAQRRDEIGDSLRALWDDKIPALDKSVRDAELRVAGLRGDPTLVGQEWRLRNETFNLQRAVEDRVLAEQELRQYEGFADWMTSAIEDVDLTLAPKEAYSIGQRLRSGSSHVYRPTSHSPITASITKIPNPIFRTLPGVADLHRPQGAYDSGSRYLDQALAYARESAETVAQERGHNTWADLRRELLEQLAAAPTDSHRRQIMFRVEQIGFDAVARRHGFSTQAANEVIEAWRSRQRELISMAKRQAQEEAFAAGRNSFKVRDSDGTLQIFKTPVDVTQLENYYLAADLRVMDTLLRRHGDSIKAMIRDRTGNLRDLGVDALSMFNHYWKPSVLLRLGYPLRTMSDEVFRVLGMTGSLASMMEHTKALGAGLENIPRRAINRTRRAFYRHELRMQRQKYPQLREAQGPESVPTVLGDIDTPNPERMRRLQDRFQKTEQWIQQDLNARARAVTTEQILDDPSLLGGERLLLQRAGEGLMGGKPGPLGGTFFTPISRVEQTSFYTGERSFFVARDEDLLKVPDSSSRPELADTTLGQYNAAIAAADTLEPGSVDRLMSMSIREVRAEIVEKFGLSESSLRGHAIGELIAIYGARLARQRGFKGVIQRHDDPDERFFDEFLDLSEGRGVKTVEEFAESTGLRIKTPKYVTNLNRTLEEFQTGDQGFMAINPMTLSRVRQGALVTPYEFTKISGAGLDAKDLARFTNDHADILSNPRSVLMIRKADDRVEVEIGFRVKKDQAAAPLRGAVFFDVDGNPMHKGVEAPSLIPLRAQVGEEPVIARGVEFEGSFGPHGSFMRAANSSGPQQANLHKGYEQNVGAARKAAGRTRTLTPKDVDFSREWARQINEEIAVSPVIRRIIDDWDDDEIVNWLRGANVRGSLGREGQEVARRIPQKSDNPYQWVAELRVLADQMLPTERLRQAVRDGEEVRAIDLESMVHTPGTPIPQSIDGVATDIALGTGTVSQFVNNTIERGYNILATLPTDTLVRNPFFSTNYRHRINQIMESAPEGFVPRLEIKRAIERRAREHALAQTKRYLFSLAENSEFVHALRFMAPFVGAWQETMVRWFRIFSERPDSFARLYVNGWADMHDLYGVTLVNQNGEIDQNGEFVQVAFPDTLKKVVAALPGVTEEDLMNIGNVRIPKNSLNVTLQGEPFWLPGPGPVMQLPATYLLRNSPHLADRNSFSKFVWSWLFPIGVPSGAREAVSPAWMNQLWRLMQGTNDGVFANLAMSIYKDDVYNWRGDGEVGPEPEFADALEKAQGIQVLYIMGRLGAPFSFQVQPESQIFIDQARQYRELYGWEEGLKKFSQEVGDDAYMWWTSMSKANLNVPPTSSGFRSYRAWQNQIEKWPELSGVFVGLDAVEDEFNYAVYERQRQLPVSPEDPRPQRGSKTPEEAIREIEALQGWQEYREFKTALKAELEARGLRSIQQARAQDLLMIQRAFISDQREKLEGWAFEFDQRDIGRNYRLVAQMREALVDGNVPDRPDWHGVREYVEIHDAFAAELDARRLAGGSRDITTVENQDLAMMWEMAIGDLTSRNPMFADVYYRWLDGHELTDGSHV